MESAFARGKWGKKGPLKIGGGSEFKTYIYGVLNPFRGSNYVFSVLEGV
jgi:hypothetical protein